MSYIGTQPVPQSLQSRQQFTGDGSKTEFATIGGVELYEDVFLNGVRLSRVDNEYSFDGTTLTITPAPANGDTVSIILRNDHSELIALPITDSQGNNVLSESGSVVTLTADAAVIEGSSSGNLVRITQTGSGNAIVVEDSTNPDSSPFVVDSSGNVGVGTSSPPTLGKLAVVGGNIVANGNGVVDPEFRLSGASSGVTRNYAMGTDSAQRLYWYDYTASAYRMVIDSGGRLLVGTTTGGQSNAIAQFYNPFSDNCLSARVSNNALAPIAAYNSSDSVVFYVSGGGTIFAVNTSISALSDVRHKENIRDLNTGLEQVLALRPRRFDWREGRGDGKKDVVGFIAQEVELVLPDVVGEWKEDLSKEESWKSLATGNMIPTLVKAIQEQQIIIESQQSQIDTLTTKTQEQDLTIASLISRIEALETPAE